MSDLQIAYVSNGTRTRKGSLGRLLRYGLAYDFVDGPYPCSVRHVDSVSGLGLTGDPEI